MGEGLIPEETKKKQTIQQLITQMLTEEKLSQSESKLISQLLQDKDPNLMAVWEVYQLMADLDDFNESIRVILNIQNKLKTKQEAIQQIAANKIVQQEIVLTDEESKVEIA